jgi:hypothetical protein
MGSLRLGRGRRVRVRNLAVANKHEFLMKRFPMQLCGKAAIDLAYPLLVSAKRERT